MASLASLRTQLSQVLHLQDSPHRISVAFAVGVFIAFSPTYGFHTLSVIFCAWAFRLNFPALMLGNLINNPWTTVPILGATMWIGFLILGMPDTPSFSWDDLSTETFYEVIVPYLLPFILGACTLSLLGSLIAYPLGRILISQYRKRNKNPADPPSCSENPA